MTSEFIANETVVLMYELPPGTTFEDNFSTVSLENILFDIVAFCVYSLAVLMSLFKKELEARIAESRPHTKGWYRQKALDFQYGFELGESDVYNNDGFTPEQISASKIVTNADAVKTIISGAGALRLKAVTTQGDELAPLSSDQLTALSVYFNEYVADAGTTVICTSNVADLLKLRLSIYYDPLVLAADGSRLDGTAATPVIDGISEYLKSIKFNGSLVLTFLEQELKSVGGVAIPVINQAWSKHSAYSYTDTAPGIGLISEIRSPDAGYMKLDIDELEIIYIPYSE